MLLALHRVRAEVRQQPESARAVLAAHPHRDLADVADVLPELGLRHVQLRYREKHDRHPAQTVAKDDYLIVREEDLGRLPPGDNLAEHTVSLHPYKIPGCL